MGSRAVLLAFALVTVSNLAHASRTDSDGEPVQAPRIARVHRESQRFALGLGHQYGPLNLLIQTTAPEPFSFTGLFSYDLAGIRLTATNRRGKTTTCECDPLNRLTGKTYPGGAPADTETYGYDENGNRTSLTDPKGQSFTYGYDALDRLTAETLPNPAPPTGDELESRITTYDANGNVTRQEESYSTSGLAVETQTWDDFDRLLTKTDRHGEAISYTYDANGNRRTVRDSDSVVTQYTYDFLNRLASQTGAGGVTTYDYFRNSLPKKTTYPNGANATQTYDLANRLSRVDNKQNTALIASYVYAYDDNGNRSEQIETNGGPPETTTYEYDEADRLTAVHYPDQTVTYTLDPVGNRKTESIVDAGGTSTSAKTLAYDVRDRLLTLTDSLDPANNATLAWDANGNQISKTQGSLVRGQIYDALDRLVEVQDNGLLLERYTYDPAGLRIRRAGPDGIFRYVRDDGAILQQTDAAGITVARYEWGGDRLVSMQHTTEGRSFSLFDGLGSVVALTRPDGGIQTRYLWDAWGNLRSQSGDSENLFGFTGYEKDDATGLYYAKARYLDPELGRFLNEDPFGGTADSPPSLHRYLYAYGNPTVFIDPDGRAACELPESLCTSEVRVDAETGQLSTQGPGSASSADASKQDSEGEEKGWSQRIVGFFMDPLLDFLTGADRTGAKVVTLGERIDQGRSRDRQLLIDEDTASLPPGAWASARGLSEVGASARQVGEVAEQAGKTSLSALEAVDRAAMVLAPAKGLVSLGEAGLRRSLASRAARGAIEKAPTTTVSLTGYNARTSLKMTEGVLKGINPARLSPDARFGEAVYLSEVGETAVAEVAYHGKVASHVIRYELNLSAARVLDLTDPAIAASWGYKGGSNYATPQAIARDARAAGFAVIKFNSERGVGANYAVLRDFGRVLQPQNVSAVK